MKKPFHRGCNLVLAVLNLSLLQQTASNEIKTVIARKMIVTKNYPVILKKILLAKLYWRSGGSVSASDPGDNASLIAVIRSILEFKML